MSTAVFTFGRFNPPTIGHEKLIKKVELISQKYRVGSGTAYFCIFPSQSQNSEKDPLGFQEKVYFMKKAFPKYKENIKSLKSIKSALYAASWLYDTGYKNIVMVVGSDRVTDFKVLLRKYNGKKSTHGFYDFESIEVESAGERDPDATGVEGMSASKMRLAVIQNQLETFKMGVPSGMSSSDAEKMFDAVAKGMGLSEVFYEGKLTDAQKRKREELVLKFKKNKADFVKRYGDRWKEVMYATATRLAQESRKKVSKGVKNFRDWSMEDGTNKARIKHQLNTPYTKVDDFKEKKRVRSRS